MLARLIRFSLAAPKRVISFYALFTLLSLAVLMRAKYDVFPEFVPPQVSVQTEAPGFNAELVEQLLLAGPFGTSPVSTLRPSIMAFGAIVVGNWSTSARSWAMSPRYFSCQMHSQFMM